MRPVFFVAMTTDSLDDHANSSTKSNCSTLTWVERLRKVLVGQGRRNPMPMSDCVTNLHQPLCKLVIQRCDYRSGLPEGADPPPAPPPTIR